MIRLAVTIIFLIIGSITDLKLNKVRNAHILFFMLLGLIINGFTLGINGLMMSFIGIGIPFIIGYPLFLLGLIPAGDIKMFMAIGAINGINEMGHLLIITLLLGGVYSVLLLLKRKDFSGFRNFYRYLKEIIIIKRLRPYDSKDSIRFPLAPITLISYLIFILFFDML